MRDAIKPEIYENMGNLSRVYSRILRNLIESEYKEQEEEEEQSGFRPGRTCTNVFCLKQLIEK